MKAAEKEVLRAGLLHYQVAKLEREKVTLQSLRQSMHEERKGKQKSWMWALMDWQAFYDLAKTQVLVVRRARLTLEAVSLQRRVDETLMAVFDDPEEEERAREHGRLAEIEGALETAGHEQWTVRNTLTGKVINSNDPRWSAVGDETLVTWLNEGPPKTLRWSELDRNARKTVEMRPDGSLVGGFPF
jgi:hypothetical protein